MDKLKQLCRRAWCWLTGGHRYKDVNLVSYHNPFDEKFYFGNRCVKCGEFKTWDVPAEAILGEVHRRSQFYVPNQLNADIDEIIDSTEG